MSTREFRDKISELLSEFADRIIAAAKEHFSSHHKGDAWQIEFARMAEEQELIVLPPENNRHDMIIKGKRVQTKHIDECRNGMVAIDNMRPVKKNDNERGYRICDYDVMALKHKGKIFLIPFECLVDYRRPGFIRSRIRICEYTRYEDFWGIFDDAEPSKAGLLF